MHPTRNLFSCAWACASKDATSPSRQMVITSRGELLPGDCAAGSALEQVAALRPPVHALIDAGALVTGYTNREVAEFLLPRLGQEYGGVVYLDEALHTSVSSAAPQGSRGPMGSALDLSKLFP